MEKRFLHVKTLSVAIFSICLVLCLLTTMPLIANSKQGNVSASTTTISISFSGFETNASIKPYCVVKYLASNGKFTTQIVTSSKSVSVAIGGKVELTIPMYCSISQLNSNTTGVYVNNNTYYIDTTNATVSSVTITYADKGYFGATTIIS